MLITYGDKGSEELLHQYGFALPDNPHERLVLPAPLAGAGPERAAQLALCQRLQVPPRLAFGDDLDAEVSGALDVARTSTAQAAAAPGQCTASQHRGLPLDARLGTGLLLLGEAARRALLTVAPEDLTDDFVIAALATVDLDAARAVVRDTVAQLLERLQHASPAYAVCMNQAGCAGPR